MSISERFLIALLMALLSLLMLYVYICGCRNTHLESLTHNKAYKMIKFTSRRDWLAPPLQKKKRIFKNSQIRLQANLDITDSMGPGKLVRHMQNPSYTYDTYLICMGLGPNISSVIGKSLSYSGPSYPSSPVMNLIIVIRFFPYFCQFSYFPPFA